MGFYAKKPCKRPCGCLSPSPFLGLLGVCVEAGEEVIYFFFLFPIFNFTKPMMTIANTVPIPIAL